LSALRTSAILRLRKSARGDVAKLRDLLKQSQSLGIQPDALQLLQFEIIYSASKAPGADIDALGRRDKNVM
jgi:hypothetical protein